MSHEKTDSSHTIAEHAPETTKTERAPLIARPVEGPINHQAISKKILERFPNTLKYLAR